MNTFDIEIPKDIPPTFPEKCIYSGQKSDDHVSIKIPSQNPLQLVVPMWNIISSNIRIDIPIARKYKRRFQLQYYGRQLGDLLIIAIAILLMFAFASITGFQDKTSFFVGLTIGVVITVAMDMLFPMVISFVRINDKITYQFTSLEYAQNFVELNEENIANIDFPL